MKKISLVLSILLIILLASCETTKSVQKKKTERKDFLTYIIDNDEMLDFLNSKQWLLAWNEGKIDVSEENFAFLYEKYIGKDSALSMLWENFFRFTENREIQKTVTDYITTHRLENNPYEKALLKKYSSKKDITITDDGYKTIRFSYNDEEYDENINYFDSYEIHPFNDEFGIMILDNDWITVSFKSTKVGEPINDKRYFVLCGGETNTMTIRFEEIENVVTDEDLQKAIDVSVIGDRYEDWQFGEVEQTGILERSGVDKYYVGYGTGPDRFIPTISDGDFIAILYNKDLKKVFKMDIFMNFSKININYETRRRLYNYMLFYTLFAYCDTAIF